MRNCSVVLFFLMTCGLLSAQRWKPAGDKIKTIWADKIDVTTVHKEYPRPILVRKDWKNLNGLWNYAIKPYGAQFPNTYDGEILVPFPVESSLSGVMKEVGASQELFYQREFTVPAAWNGKNIQLHFGAVDWKAEVWLNEIKIGSHTGGYAPFSFDITPFLDENVQNLVVKVWDPTSDGTQPRGKQVNKPEGIWYTPVTGIWQTVWIEPVGKNSITAMKTTPNVDHNSIRLKQIPRIQNMGIFWRLQFLKMVSK